MKEFSGATHRGGMPPQAQRLLQEYVDHAHRIVFFGGAGVSTESGIPDFRSATGLYAHRYAGGLRPEQILSNKFLESDPETFFAYYRSELVHPEAKPNAAHKALAALERSGRLLGVITQNIDGLDAMAGTHNVVELHGSTMRNFCVDCGRTYPRATVMEATGVPRCPACGGMIRPDVVLYGEALSERALNQAADWLHRADLLIVAGTSLSVYPAAGLIRLYSGDRLVLINMSATQADAAASLVIRAPVGEVLGALSIPGVEPPSSENVADAPRD